MKIWEEKNKRMSSSIKEIEWWNEIRPWRNSIEDFNETKPTRNSIDRSNSRTYSGSCPLTFDGVFGLTIAEHQLRLCSSNKQICLYQHFLGKHAFTHGNAIRLVQAVIRNDDPRKVKVFSSNSILFNPHHRVRCPLAEEKSSKTCSTFDITRKSIRRHLLLVHQLDRQRVDDLIRNLYK